MFFSSPVLLLMCVFSSPGLLPDGESSIDRQLKATDSQLARVRFSHISCDFVVVCVMKYWFWYLFSVIQTVFNTFLSMLDRRFHGMIKVKNPQSMKCSINSEHDQWRFSQWPSVIMNIHGSIKGDPQFWTKRNFERHDGWVFHV